MTQSPPLGYTIIPPPGTMREVYTDYRMVDKAVTIVKSAVQQYIDSFLNPAGSNRNFLTSSVSPVGLQFVTDLTYDDQMKVNPNLRKTYLAKFFAENIGRLPSILLIDTGVEIIDSGINDLIAAGMNIDGSWQGYLMSLMKVSISITTATLSEEDTSTLATMVATMIAPLATIINNNILRDTESGISPWEVRLPMSGMTLGQASSVTIEGDSKTTVWTRAIELACDFEAHIGIKQPPQKYIVPSDVTIGESTAPKPVVLNLRPNQELSLGATYPLLIEGMNYNYYLSVSDPRIALVTSEPPYVLQPKAQGQCLLLINDRNVSTDLMNNNNLKNPSCVAEISFFVVR